MKKFWGILLCCILLTGVCLAEGNGYETLASMDGFYGVWTACGGNDSLPYLVLHDDQTYEAYDYWQIDDETTTGDALLKRGSFTFTAADGSLALEGDDTVYTAQTAMATDDLESSDGALQATSDMKTLLLSAPLTDEDGESSILFLPMAEGADLLPTSFQLCGNWEWAVSATPSIPEESAIRYVFLQDGTGAVVSPTGEGAPDTEAPLTYVLDNGRLALRLEDGTIRNLLLQYHYVPMGEGGLLNMTDIAYDESKAEEMGWSTAMTDKLILVRDLDDGSIFYLVRLDG